MAQAAEDAGSVISAVLFGALAGAGVLPFSRAQFEATIERGGVGVKPSLKAFGAAFVRAQGAATGRAGDATCRDAAPQPKHPAVRALVERVQRDFPAAAHPVLLEGVRRLIDYQDLAYAGLYLDRAAAIAALPIKDEHRLLRETARHLALWMSYEDTARVAALKTRASRFERVRGEARVQDGQVLAIHEYMHPRLQEICETLPGGLGPLADGLEAAAPPRRAAARSKGRVIQTSSLRGYLMLQHRRRDEALAPVHAALSPRRTARIEEWLQRIAITAASHPELAVEVAQCQRLVKGYSDTHERGLRNYDTVMAAVQRAGTALRAGHAARTARRRARRRTRAQAAGRAGAACARLNKGCEHHHDRHAPTARRRSARTQPADPHAAPSRRRRPPAAGLCCRRAHPRAGRAARRQAGLAPLLADQLRGRAQRHRRTRRVRDRGAQGGRRPRRLALHARAPERRRSRSPSRRRRTTFRCTPAPAARCWWPAASASRRLRAWPRAAARKARRCACTTRAEAGTDGLPARAAGAAGR